MQIQHINDRLYASAYWGHTYAMRGYLSEGADVDYNFGAPLRSAAERGHAEAVQILVENGANVDKKEQYGFPALYSAAGMGNVEIMRILLAAGADVHTMSPWVSPTHSNSPRMNPLHFVLTHTPPSDRKECAQLLLSYGARVDDTPGNLKTPLWIAINHGRRDLAKLFLRAGAREIAAADLPDRNVVNPTTLDLVATIRAAGGWVDYVAKHRRVLAGLVTKLSAKSVVPVDAASRIVAFWCPPGGY